MEESLGLRTAHQHTNNSHSRKVRSTNKISRTQLYSFWRVWRRHSIVITTRILHIHRYPCSDWCTRVALIVNNVFVHHQDRRWSNKLYSMAGALWEQHLSDGVVYVWYISTRASKKQHLYSHIFFSVKSYHTVLPHSALLVGSISEKKYRVQTGLAVRPHNALPPHSCFLQVWRRVWGTRGDT